MKNKKRKSILQRKTNFEKNEPWGDWVNVPTPDEIKKAREADESYSLMIKKLYLEEFERSMSKAFWFGFALAAALLGCVLCCLVAIK